MSKMSRPSSTPTTIDAKLSSSKIISCSHLVLRHQNQLFLNNKQHLFSGHAASFDRTNLGIGKLEQTFPWGIDFSDVFCTKVSPGRLTALGNNGNPLIKMSQTWSSLVYVKASFNYFADGDFALNSPTQAWIPGGFWGILASFRLPRLSLFCKNSLTTRVALQI